MVVQPSQTRVCLSCQSPEASSRTAQLAVEIARLNAALRNGSRLDWRLARRPTASRSFPERGWTGAEDRLWPVIRGLTC